ncbi:MAG: class I SAM-dependent methyltransferase [Deltaproteobacteria bacterium]|nr:MAG: class I SAM-dependent methyltransferase [Deltaproteobacteria bacterium]
MENDVKQLLFRNENGDIKEAFSHIEGVSFKEHPLELFILLARYKFAARLLEKEASVLDAGCGLGLGSVFLSKFCKKVTAVDFDKDMILKNKSQYADVTNLSFDFIDLTQTPKPEQTYDTVISLDVIEHFPKEKIGLVVENLSKLTRSNGFAIIGTPNVASKPYASSRRLETHHHEFEPNELKSLLKNNFKNVFLFSMTDEVVSLSFPQMAWYLMALCVK